MRSRPFPLLAVLCLAIVSCSDGGESEDQDQSGELIYVENGVARCFPDQGKVVLELNGVPVYEATVKRYAKLLRGRNPALTETQATKLALRQAARGQEQTGILLQAAVYARYREKLPEMTAKALGLLDRLKNGEKFEDLAREASDHADSKSNGGHLGRYGRDKGKAIGYLSLQDVAWSVEVGEVSQPIVSEFGIHLLKVNDEIPGTSKEKDQRELLQILIAFDADAMNSGSYRSAVLANAFTEADFVFKDDEYKTLIPDHLWHR